MMTMEEHEGAITAGELRKMIAGVADDELILFMKEDDGVGYNAASIEFTSAVIGEDEESSFLATLWIIN